VASGPKTGPFRCGPYHSANPRLGDAPLYGAALTCRRNGGTSPASPNRRTALASATSNTTASPGSRPQMKVTTQSSHAGVSCITQSSQEISMYSTVQRG
jgi:hypothetical protein